MPKGKREMLAAGLFRSGALGPLGLLPVKDSLLVLNYHRIGDPARDLFDPGVFSATAAEFNDQIAYVKRHLTPVTLEEALDFVEGRTRDRSGRSRVLITFDDGYLDNYQEAFPILRSHGVQGVFFLATTMVGSCAVPWWDHIAYLTRTARKRRCVLRYPDELSIDFDQNGLSGSLRDILRLSKSPRNTDPARFLSELQQALAGDAPPATLRRFLDWEEAREMLRGGMAIGSHTHSHTVLSQLDPEGQLRELAGSRAELAERLGVRIDALAYPVGGPTSFTAQTRSLAEEAGYRVAFSFFGGVNLPGRTNRYSVSRVGIDGLPLYRFKVQAAVCRATGRFWP